MGTPRTFVLVAGALVAVAAAGGVASAHNVRLTIESAKLDGKKLRRGARSTAHISDIACYSEEGLRAIPGLCDKGTLPPDAWAVDAIVRVEIGDSVVRTYTVPGTLTPKWDYAAVLDTDFLAGTGNAKVALIDFGDDGQDHVLAETDVPLVKLRKNGEHTLTLGGHTVHIRIEELADTTPTRTYALRVPAGVQIGDLAKKAPIASSTKGSGNYELIPVAEGERITIAATGKVRPNFKKHPERNAGPDGIPVIKEKIQFNEPGFRNVSINHAGLIAEIGSIGMFVGSHHSFTVERSGLLLLAINDAQEEDDDGGFDVKVDISEPPVTPEATPPPNKKGGARDRVVAGAIDPRIVEQVVDAHAGDIDTCVSAAPNPYGSLTVSFAISGDGSLLGVTIENPSPNLKTTGDCIRKKALGWRFPPPRGTVTVRYPLSFSAS